jgi:protein tyrosine phosphatase type IVA
LELVKETFFEHGKIKKTQGNTPCIAVHCLSGLGRAPVLVAIALIEAGLDPSHTVDLIRRNRQGALNQNQIGFLMGYKRHGVFNKSCCIIF